jgi:hypothetical protein
MVSRAPPVVVHPPVFRPDWETLARLAFTPNKLLDLDACPAPTSFHRFCGATDKLKSAWFWGPNQENRRGDFEAQITKPELPVLRPKPENPPPHWFWGSTKKLTTSFEAKRRETVATSFEDKLEKTFATGFEAKPAKTVRVVLRPNHS